MMACGWRMRAAVRRLPAWLELKALDTEPEMSFLNCSK